jgi:hypothetical protein
MPPSEDILGEYPEGCGVVVTMTPTHMNGHSPNTEIVRLSELRKKVIQPIFELRDPDAMPEYRKALAKYEKLRKDRPEKTRGGEARKLTLSGTKTVGFDLPIFFEDGKRMYRGGEPASEFVPRPIPPSPNAWGYSGGYSMSFGGSKEYTSGSQHGILADPLYNREIRKQRVEEYAELMKDGKWHDLISDPIAITEDGQVVNGQHRLAAADQIILEEGDPDPLFLVIWGVDPKEAMFADGSRRTDRDEKTIATRLVRAAA